MSKIIKLILKPSKLYLILLILAPIVIVLLIVGNVADMNAFIIGISTGIYGGVLMLIHIYNKDNSPFDYAKLLFSIPINRKNFVFPWLIANHISFASVYIVLILSIFISSFIKPIDSLKPITFLCIFSLTLISCIIFNLYTIIKTIDSNNKSLIYFILSYLIGLVIMYVTIKLLGDIFTKPIELFFASLTIIILYFITSYLCYKKISKYILNFQV